LIDAEKKYRLGGRQQCALPRELSAVGSGDGLFRHRPADVDN
jgi:hypothetical protein